MNSYRSTELVVQGVAAHTPVAPSKVRRAAQMAGASALSFGMVSVFSIPAYATEPGVGQVSIEDFGEPLQSFEAANAADAIVPVTAPEGKVGAAILEQERAAAEAKARAEAEARARAEAGARQSAGVQVPAAAPSGVDVPAGVGAQGIVSAALAQLGVFQDCTALVEKALRAVGIQAGDLGTQIGEYTALGGRLVTSGDYAPGDILIWPGRHVAVYIGNGQAVHGGYGGNQTVVANAFIDGAPGGVVRFG